MKLSINAIALFVIALMFFGITSAEQDWIEVGEYQFGSSNSIYPEEQYITIDKSYVESGENIILLENANPKWSGYWLVWDYLKLEVSGQSVWELGENEAPPDYSEKAFDEFDQNKPFNSHYYVETMDSKDFPKEINDGDFTQIYIHYNLAEKPNRDLRLFLDTLYATHDTAPYFNLRIKVKKPVATYPRVVASSVEGPGLEAYKAIDGDLTTRWSSNFTDNEWIYVDFGSPNLFNTVTLNWETAYANAYQIQVSDDATNWKTVYSTTSGDGGIDTIYVGNQSARFIKMNGLKRATEWGYSLWEFTVSLENDKHIPIPILVGAIIIAVIIILAIAIFKRKKPSKTKSKELKNYGVPNILVSITSNKGFKVGIWEKLNIKLLNIGDGIAKNLRIDLSGPLEVGGGMPINILDANGGEEETVIGIKPKEPGNIPLNLRISFADAKNKDYVIEDFAYISVAKESEPVPKGPITIIDKSIKIEAGMIKNSQIGSEEKETKT